MLYKALKSFCGAVSARPGEVLEINDATSISDLTRAGFISQVETNKTTGKSARAGGKNSGGGAAGDGNESK